MDEAWMSPRYYQVFEWQEIDDTRLGIFKFWTFIVTFNAL